MIATQEITFGITGQSLIFDCPDGRPTSIVGVTVYAVTQGDDGDDEAATTGAASVETNPNTTLAASAGVGDQSITLTAATGVAVGRRLLITAAAGHREEIEVGRVTGTVITLRHPLINAYPITTSTVVSTRCTIGMDPTWIADVGNICEAYAPNPGYRTRWVVALAGSSQVYDRYFDLVRYPARHNVSPLDVELRHPGWLDGLAVDFREDQGRALIERAWSGPGGVKADLYQDAKADQAIRNSELVAELVITKALVLRNEDAFFAGALDVARLEAVRGLYAQRYNAVIRAPVAPMSSASGASSTIRPTPIWRR